ncbi:MAG: Daunorubicin ketoreductase [Flavisolibacter sp.]|nr:Daunorubicin ketoreductase [Flavisolibacter sp.]
MARIFITGSADGLGQLAAKALIARAHQVVLHARNEKRGREALDKAPGAEGVAPADLASIEETKQVAAKVNALGTFDAVIHNAGLYQASAKELFYVNTLAPYILTSLVEKPKRLIYLSSDMHQGGWSKLESFKTDISRITYSDTKLHVLMLCKAVARKWTDVYANALNPGWVPTKMGGPGAPDSFESGYKTQVWLATSNEEKVKVSGRFFYHQKEVRSNPEADDVQLQDRFMDLCQQITGIAFPF